MIYVRKIKNGVPAAFRVIARDELARIQAHFSSSSRPKQSFKFKAYRHPELKVALEKLFNGKCAYCEWRYGGGSYFEVEHYRPKNHYYWLAADWSNLLPSCKRCNLGKLNKFPLADPNKQARRKGQEKHERPLLLNPSNRKPRPQDHLIFNTQDGSIQPAIDHHGRVSSIGKTSISLYRLARTELSRDRKEWSMRVRTQIQLCKAARSKVALEETYQDLKHLLEPFQPFRALTIGILRESGIAKRSSGN